MSDLYSRAMRSILADSAVRRLESEGLILTSLGNPDEQTFLRDFAPYLSAAVIIDARRMTYVYALFFCFENLVRELVQNTMFEAYGASWWEKVPQNVQKGVAARGQKRDDNKWHVSENTSNIGGTLFGDLASIIISDWKLFEELFPSQDWVKTRLTELELSRNVIAHAGLLSSREIKRVEQYFEDWLKQVP